LPREVVHSKKSSYTPQKNKKKIKKSPQNFKIIKKNKKNPTILGGVIYKILVHRKKIRKNPKIPKKSEKIRKFRKNPKNPIKNPKIFFEDLKSAHPIWE
jgi:hypothetical protein